MQEASKKAESTTLPIAPCAIPALDLNTGLWQNHVFCPIFTAHFHRPTWTNIKIIGHGPLSRHWPTPRGWGRGEAVKAWSGFKGVCIVFFSHAPKGIWNKIDLTWLDLTTPSPVAALGLSTVRCPCAKLYNIYSALTVLYIFFKCWKLENDSKVIHNIPRLTKSEWSWLWTSGQTVGICFFLRKRAQTDTIQMLTAGTRKKILHTWIPEAISWLTESLDTAVMTCCYIYIGKWRPYKQTKSYVKLIN